MPDSFAPCSIFLRLIRICVSVETIEKITVTSTITREGITSAGAKWKIWPTYNREVMEVSPVLMTMFISMEQS